MRKYLLIVLAVYFSVYPVFAYATEKTGLERDINWLIEKVRISGYIFIRNGEEYSSEEAAKHIRKKYEYYKDKIRTVQDFIDYAASGSAVSGKTYLLKDRQGNTIKTRDWLMKIFRDKRELTKES